MTLIRRLFISATAELGHVRREPRGQLLQHARNSQGVALPVALLALVAVSIIVTSVLLSSVTEVSLSAAHKDATRGLFRAEGAIEAYVAQNQLALDTVTNRRYLPPGSSTQDSVLITVSRLASVRNPDSRFSGDTLNNDTTFSIASTPIRGGRQVVAMIDKVFRAVNMTVEGGLISGDTVRLAGNTTVSDGSDSPLGADGNAICADTVGGKAIQTSPGATVGTSGNVTVVGEQEETPVARTDLVQSLFGTDLQSLIQRADIKFAAGQFGQDPITSDPQTKWPKVANKSTPQNTPYNWGCPADIYLKDDKNPSLGTACIIDGDETHRPIVAIDAGGGTVTANLSHGQGMLIIYNGNLKVAGNFTYKGVVLVEGNFDIFATGGGASAPKIEGAVIGVGAGSKIDNDVAGSPTIRYNRCAINLLRQQWEETKVFRRMGDRTYGWSEIVR